MPAWVAAEAPDICRRPQSPCHRHPEEPHISPVAQLFYQLRTRTGAVIDREKSCSKFLSGCLCRIARRSRPSDKVFCPCSLSIIRITELQATNVTAWCAPKRCGSVG